jgi:hypothetical protein
MMTMLNPFHHTPVENRGRHADFELISPLLSQSTGVAPASSTEPPYSQPKGGKRIPSQTSRHHHETLGQTRQHPDAYIQVGASDGCPSECNQHRAMTGSLRRLQELAACYVQKRLLFASDEGGASDGCPSECNQYCSLQPEDHRTLHDEIDGGRNPLGDDERDDLNAELAQALSSEQGE